MLYLVPESGTRHKLVPDCMTHLPETVTSFLVPVSGTSFWSVCHGHYRRISHCVFVWIVRCVNTTPTYINRSITRPAPAAPTVSAQHQSDNWHAASVDCLTVVDAVINADPTRREPCNPAGGRFRRIVEIRPDPDIRSDVRTSLPKTRLGDWLFAVVSPLMWNVLSASLCLVDINTRCRRLLTASLFDWDCGV